MSEGVTAPVIGQDQRYAAMFHSAVGFAIFATDREGRVTDWNPAAERILGWSAGELIGQAADRLFTPEDRAMGRMGAEMRQALNEGRADDERWHMRRDGSRLWASGELTPLRSPDGTHLGFLKILRDRTEPRAAIEEQQANAEFLRSVLASSGDCIKVLDLDGKLTFMSEGGQRVMEVSDFNAIRGCPWPDLWKGEGNVAAKAALDAARNGGVGHFQGSADTFAGNSRYWDVQVTAILGADGRPERILSVSRNITATRLTQQALLEAEALNTPILNSSRDCIVILDLEGHNLYVSPGGIVAMDVTDVDAILGLSWLRVWKQPPDAQAATEAVKLAREGGVGRFQGLCPTHKGTPKWWDVAISPLLGPDGKPERLVSVGRDITAQKALEVELRHTNANLEQRVAERTADRNRMWQLSTDIIVVARFDGSITAVNPAWTATLGWTEAELIGSNLLGIVHPDDLAASTRAVEAVAGGDTIRAFENRYRHKDGTHRWIAWTAVPGDDLINAVGRDVTVEKERAAAVRQIEEQLRQSQKMEAVGQLTGGLAHDFNNLLTGISGSLELLQTRMRQGRLGDLERYIATAQGAAKRAAALTHRLLAFSRRQTLDPKPTDVNRLVAEMEELIRRTVGPAVHVEVVGTAGLWTTLIDPPQLESALLNLCINARDAMPDGGRLTIETANRWLDERAGQGRDLVPGQYLSLCVTDTGTGMTPEVAKRAFDPFYTTKPIGEGTGLGLSMIYGFARQSGGQVRIYSELGQGTMMCIYLPRYHGKNVAADLDVATATRPRAEQGQTVLVVDDEASVRMLVAEVLAEEGYVAVEAADGASGLRVLQSDARIDLLVTDVGLPGGMNGRQMADAARVSRPDLRVLFITGYAENAAVGNGHLAPGMQVLTKPFSMEALASRIRSLITRT